MNFGELRDQDDFVDNQKIAKVRDIVIDPEMWKITHLVIELTKDAVEEVLVAGKSTLNRIAMSAFEKGMACCHTVDFLLVFFTSQTLRVSTVLSSQYAEKEK